MNLLQLLQQRTGSPTLARSQQATLSMHDAGNDQSGCGPATETAAVSATSPINLVRQLIALDGRVRRMLLLSPSLPPDSVAHLMAAAGCQALVTDRNDLKAASGRLPSPGPRIHRTEWLLTTSGTTGPPKVVSHTLGSIIARTRQGTGPAGEPARWGLLYEASRFAGLQVVMQALLGGGLLLAPEPGELPERLAFLAREGCSHLSATPTLWRKCLMLPGADQLRLRQITVGGEIADDRLLAALQQNQPQARITHIYASTELGVGFSVHDGRAGFPLHYLAGLEGISFRIKDGVLWARPDDERASILAPHIRKDEDGFACTEDRVEVEGDRVLFRGRESSVVNVGGVKVQIEEVERIAAECPGVAECAVEARKNPFSGYVLSLSVVLKPGVAADDARSAVRDWCTDHLPREARPATIRVVDAIAVSAGGKTARVVTR